MADLTLLERFDKLGSAGYDDDEIRRAIAIAQIVEEDTRSTHFQNRKWAKSVLAFADELLRGGK